ncbi:MAG TPA: hypothetical protein VGI36_08495 [Candidatus Binataceae bacterium]|jgi:hypothetical protein
MRALRIIFLAGLIFALAGSAFASNKGGNGNGGYGNGNGNSGKGYQAPEFDLSGPLKYGLLAIAGGSVVLLERRRRRRRASLAK